MQPQRNPRLGELPHYAEGGLIAAFKGMVKPAAVSTAKPGAPAAAAPLGSGAAEQARTAIRSRPKTIDDAEKAAVGMAKGGSIKGKGTGTSDDVPIMASTGEYMVKAAAVKKLGVPFMDKINAIADGDKAERAKPKLGAIQRPAGKPHMADGGYIFDEYRNPRPQRAQGAQFIRPARAPEMLANQSNPTSAAMVANGRNPLHPVVQAPNFTTSPGAAAPSNAIPLVTAPEPIAATTSPGATPQASPPRAPAPAFSGDPMHPVAQGPAPAGIETPPKPITGGPTLPGTQPTQQPVAQVRRGTGFTVAEPVKAPSLGARALGAVTRSAGPALGAAGMIPGQLNVADVAANPNASANDVATQQAQELGRFGAAGVGAAAGGALGLMTGPAAPVLAPLGAIAGGAYGYWAADKAIEGGRRLAGTDPRAPIERVAPAPVAPVTAVAAPAATYPETVNRRPQAVVPVVAAPAPAVAIPQPQAPALGQIKRVGNSYSGPPGLSGDVSVNGRAPSVSSIDTSQGYAQDLKELGRIDAQKAEDRANLREQDIYNQVAAGNYGNARALRRQAKQEAETKAAGQAATERAATQQLARDKFNVEASTAGLANKAAMRLGALQDRVSSAKTPAEQAAAEDTLRAFMGKNKQPPLEQYAYAPGGQTIDPATGVAVTQPGVIFNKQTGEIKSPNKASPSQKFELNKIYVDGKGNRAKWDGQKFVPL